MTALDKVITQKYLRRYPESKRTKLWEGAPVHIATEHGVWRIGGHGYTWAGASNAWILPFEDAQKQVAHCGPEKKAKFIRALITQEGEGSQMTPEHIRSLWEDYLEAAMPSGATENGAIDLYDIEDMNDAAYALHQCCVALLAEIAALKGGA